MDLRNYSLWDIIIPEVSSCKYLGIILSRDLSCAGQVSYTAKNSLEDTAFYNGCS
jgi:hypothetical protein